MKTGFKMRLIIMKIIHAKYSFLIPPQIGVKYDLIITKIMPQCNYIYICINVFLMVLK